MDRTEARQLARRLQKLELRVVADKRDGVWGVRHETSDILYTEYSELPIPADLLEIEDD